MKEAAVAWSRADHVLTTRVRGVLGAEDVRAWEAELWRAAGALAEATPFKLLADLRGYEVSEQRAEVHQAQRTVVPLFLAAHGFRVGFFDLYQQEPHVEADPSRARCVAVAHVHHDGGKMERYDELLGRPGERFFTDPDEALAWLRQAPAYEAAP